MLLLVEKRAGIGYTSQVFEYSRSQDSRIDAFRAAWQTWGGLKATSLYVTGADVMNSAVVHDVMNSNIVHDFRSNQRQCIEKVCRKREGSQVYRNVSQAWKDTLCSWKAFVKTST